MHSVWDAIVLEAQDESPLWADCVLPDPEREPLAVFSTLGGLIGALVFKRPQPASTRDLP